MKNITITIFVFILLFSGAYSQTAVMVDPKTTSIETAQKMIGINKLTEKTKSNLNNLKKIDIQKDNLGQRVAYFESNSLKIIKVYLTDNGIEKNIEWYYSDEKLIYSEANWEDISTNKIVNTVKCYFDNNHLITWIDFGNKFLDPNTDTFRERDSEMTIYGKKLYDEAIKK